MDKVKEKLVLDHIILADKIASQMLSKLKNKYSIDELRSSAYLGLINAAKNYDVNNNIPFENFARKRIKGSILDEVKDDKRYNVKRGVPHERPIQSLNSTSCNEAGKSIEYIDLVQAKEDCFEDLLINYEIEKLLLCLDHKERELIDMYYFKCLTHEEIAQILKVHRTTITKALKKIIEKIKGCQPTAK